MNIYKILQQQIDVTVRALFGRNIFRWTICKVDGEWRMFPPYEAEYLTDFLTGMYYTFPTGAQALEAFRRGQ